MPIQKLTASVITPAIEGFEAQKKRMRTGLRCDIEQSVYELID